MTRIRVGSLDVVVTAGVLHVDGDDEFFGVRVAPECPACVLEQAAERVAARHQDRKHRELVAADCRRIYERSQTLARAAAPHGWANGFAALAM